MSGFDDLVDVSFVGEIFKRKNSSTFTMYIGHLPIDNNIAITNGTKRKVILTPEQGLEVDPITIHPTKKVIKVSKAGNAEANEASHMRAGLAKLEKALFKRPPRPQSGLRLRNPKFSSSDGSDSHGSLVGSSNSSDKSVSAPSSDEKEYVEEMRKTAAACAKKGDRCL